MTTSHEISDGGVSDHVNTDAGDDVMFEAGKLDGMAQEFGDDAGCEDVDPEEVGHWITAIGKALLAIFKP